jgi:hypothetical protein
VPAPQSDPRYDHLDRRGGFARHLQHTAYDVGIDLMADFPDCYRWHKTGRQNLRLLLAERVFEKRARSGSFLLGADLGVQFPLKGQDNFAVDLVDVFIGECLFRIFIAQMKG